MNAINLYTRARAGRQPQAQVPAPPIATMPGKQAQSPQPPQPLQIPPQLVAPVPPSYPSGSVYGPRVSPYVTQASNAPKLTPTYGSTVQQGQPYYIRQAR